MGINATFLVQIINLLITCAILHRFLFSYMVHHIMHKRHCEKALGHHIEQKQTVVTGLQEQLVKNLAAFHQLVKPPHQLILPEQQGKLPEIPVLVAPVTISLDQHREIQMGTKEWYVKNVTRSF